MHNTHLLGPVEYLLEVLDGAVVDAGDVVLTCWLDMPLTTLTQKVVQVFL